jgi:hypothetical protein
MISLTCAQATRISLAYSSPTSPSSTAALRHEGRRSGAIDTSMKSQKHGSHMRVAGRGRVVPAAGGAAVRRRNPAMIGAQGQNSGAAPTPIGHLPLARRRISSHRWRHLPSRSTASTILIAAPCTPTRPTPKSPPSSVCSSSEMPVAATLRGWPEPPPSALPRRSLLSLPPRPRIP